MAIEIDNAQTFQNRNALGQFPSKCRFVSRIRVHSALQLFTNSRLPIITAALPTTRIELHWDTRPLGLESR